MPTNNLEVPSETRKRIPEGMAILIGYATLIIAALVIWWGAGRFFAFLIAGLSK